MTAMIGHSSLMSPTPGAGILPTPSSVSGPSGFQATSSPAYGSSSQNFGRGRFPNNRPTNRSGYYALRPSSGFPSSGITPECQICSKRGHTVVNCFYRNPSSTSSPSSSMVECQICSKRGHGALDCYHRSNYVYQGSHPPPTLNVMTAQVSYAPKTMWIADNGASHHMVSNVNTLETA